MGLKWWLMAWSPVVNFQEFYETVVNTAIKKIKFYVNSHLNKFYKKKESNTQT